jgi:hypothetical protein
MATVFAFVFQMDGPHCPVTNYSSEVNETIRTLPDAHIVENDDTASESREADETQ